MILSYRMRNHVCSEHDISIWNWTFAPFWTWPSNQPNLQMVTSTWVTISPVFTFLLHSKASSQTATYSLYSAPLLTRAVHFIGNRVPFETRPRVLVPFCKFHHRPHHGGSQKWQTSQTEEFAEHYRSESNVRSRLDWGLLKSRTPIGHVPFGFSKVLSNGFPPGPLIWAT